MPEDFDGSRHVERLATQVTQLPDGLLLVVATDSFDVQQLRHRLGRFTIWSGIAIAAFALIGGYLVGASSCVGSQQSIAPSTGSSMGTARNGCR
ncbi:hypothetical protein MOP88_01040 [Sphingomonas sp. WKB10]|nr:hypothetical protein [Sphingomonas sp. WKB10]